MNGTRKHSQAYTYLYLLTILFKQEQLYEGMTNQCVIFRAYVPFTPLWKLSKSKYVTALILISKNAYICRRFTISK